MKKYVYLISALVLIGLGVYVGFLLFKPKPAATAKVDSLSIVSMLREEGFLVTQTYIVNQQVKITSGTGNIFRDFFLGQEINAFGTMKVSSGVDLLNVSENDISVDENTIRVLLPPVETQSVELLGDLTLQNRQGILKRIFNNDDGYNTAYQALRTEVLATATTSTLRAEAEHNTQNQVERLVKFAVPSRGVIVTFKQ